MGAGWSRRPLVKDDECVKKENSQVNNSEMTVSNNNNNNFSLENKSELKLSNSGRSLKRPENIKKISTKNNLIMDADINSLINLNSRLSNGHQLTPHQNTETTTSSPHYYNLHQNLELWDSLMKV